MKAPLRVLCRARDLYIRSMTSCAGSIERGGGIAAASLGYAPPFADLPRSFSLQSRRSSSADEDLRELVRVASLSRARSLGLGTAPTAPPAVVPRSQSVAVGRIDEDKPCYDFGDAKLGADLLLPRSRSCAAGAKKSPRMFV